MLFGGGDLSNTQGQMRGFSPHYLLFENEYRRVGQPVHMNACKERLAFSHNTKRNPTLSPEIGKEAAT